MEESSLHTKKNETRRKKKCFTFIFFVYKLRLFIETISERFGKIFEIRTLAKHRRDHCPGIFGASVFQQQSTITLTSRVSGMKQRTTKCGHYLSIFATKRVIFKELMPKAGRQSLCP